MYLHILLFSWIKIWLKCLSVIFIPDMCSSWAQGQGHWQGVSGVAPGLRDRAIGKEFLEKFEPIWSSRSDGDEEIYKEINVHK